jgi:hypothetical protein
MTPQVIIAIFVVSSNLFVLPNKIFFKLMEDIKSE